MDKIFKYVTRNYTLLEHNIMVESLLEGYSSLPEIYYTYCVEISKSGLMDIYIRVKDFEGNKKRMIKCIKEDPKYAAKRLVKGLEVIKHISKIPIEILDDIYDMENNKIIDEFLKIRQIFFDFSGYVEFTHYIGKLDVKLTDDELNELAKLHEDRKSAFMNYFDFIKKFTKEIARKMKIKSLDLSFTNCEEIIKLLKGDINPVDLDNLQEKRRKGYIMYYENGKEIIITEYLNKEIEKLNKIIIENKEKEIRGISINKGIIRGVVEVINQNTPLNKIPIGKIIVTSMTTPDMTTILKKSKAIVTDEGGLLCHAANIAREFGVIAVIGTKVATKILKTGDIVEVDADNGVVRILEREKR